MFDIRCINESDTVVIFGGNGFLGRYVVPLLAKTGAKIKIIYKNSIPSRELLISGAVGQISFIRAATDIEYIQSINGSYVINLVGIFAEKGNDTFYNIHVKLASMIASYARDANVKRFVHVSALGIGELAKVSCFAATKLSGEKAVLDIFPQAIIIRPAVMFGVDDHFLRVIVKAIRFLPVVPLFNGGGSKLQSVYVGDVAKAIVNCLVLPKKEVCGQVIDLGGNAQYTLRQLLKMITLRMFKHRIIVPLPFSIVYFATRILQLILPGMTLSTEQLKLFTTSNVTNHSGFTRLGVQITPLRWVIDKIIAG